ncbi:LOW QUALITY PROTEIN: hypothetical protein U9M48_039941, partial [Paspalum notatum var. saurae]
MSLNQLVHVKIAAEGWSADHPKWSGGHVFCSNSLHVVPLGSLTSPILVPAHCDPWIYWMLSCMVGSSPFCVCLHTGSKTWQVKWSRDHSTWSGVQIPVGGWPGATTHGRAATAYFCHFCSSSICDMFATILCIFWYLNPNIH